MGRGHPIVFSAYINLIKMKKQQQQKKSRQRAGGDEYGDRFIERWISTPGYVTEQIYQIDWKSQI